MREVHLTHVPQELQRFPRLTVTESLVRMAWTDFGLCPELHHIQVAYININHPAFASAAFAYATSISGLQRICTPISGENTMLCLTLCADYACASCTEPDGIWYKAHQCEGPGCEPGVG